MESGRFGLLAQPRRTSAPARQRRGRGWVAAGFVALVVSAFAACHRADPNAHFQKGNDYASRSQFQEAILEYRAALQIDPKRGDIRRKLAEAYLSVRDGGNALKELLRAADLMPNDASLQIETGSVLLAAGQFEDAKTRANKALVLDPKNTDAQILLGNALVGLKDMEGAMSEYQEALALNPTEDTAYLNIATIQMVRGNQPEAEASFRKAVEVAPKSITARMALANYLWWANRAPEAEQTLKDALALDPNNLEANQALGIFYLASKRANEAEPYFKKIVDTAKTTAARIGLADYYVAAQRYDDAKQVLKDLSQQANAYASAMTRLAAIDVAQGDRAQGMAKLRDVLNKYPKDTSARLLMTRLLLVDGKRDEALANATTITKDEPMSANAAEAYLLIGRIEASLDRNEAAIKAFEEVLKRQPRPLAADLALAGIYLQSGNFDKTSTYLQQARAIDPNNALARSLEVRLLYGRHDYTRARQALASLRNDFPNAPLLWNLLAVQQVADGQIDAARASYTKAAQAMPGDIESLAGLVSLDLMQHKATDAVNRVEAAAKVVAPSATFLMLSAQTYLAAGNSAKAEEMLKRAIDADPARLQAYGMLGQLYLTEKRLDDAKDQFQKVVERNPQSTSANTMLGMLLETQQKLPEAEQQYQKVLAIDSRAAVASNNLAWLYVASDRNLDQALQLAQTAQSQLPDEPHVNDTLGWIYYKKKLYPQAVKSLEASLQKDASDPSVHYHLGMAYLQVSDFEKAKKQLQIAVAAKTDFAGSADAKKALAQLGG
jgi:tetratricopeptide (TPR) repeat protein